MTQPMSEIVWSAVERQTAEPYSKAVRKEKKQ